MLKMEESNKVYIIYASSLVSLQVAPERWQIIAQILCIAHEHNFLNISPETSLPCLVARSHQKDPHEFLQSASLRIVNVILIDLGQHVGELGTEDPIIRIEDRELGGVVIAIHNCRLMICNGSSLLGDQYSLPYLVM